MRNPSLPCLLAIGLAATLQPILAQATDSVSVQFVSFPAVSDPQSVELVAGEGKILEVQIPSNVPSPVYQVARSGSWTLGKSGQPKDGKPQFTVFGTAPSLASTKQLILLFRKGPANADGFKVFPIDSASQFGKKMFLVLNLSREELATEIGGVKFALKPGAQQIVSPKANQGEDLCHVELYYRKEEKWKPFFSSNWPLHEDTRSMIFIYSDPVNSRIKFHSVEVRL